MSKRQVVVKTFLDFVLS